MRLWSLHPRYLDRQGLTACWREGLLAQAVLAGRTKGYTQHPQLARFRVTPDPVGTVGAYLTGVADEAQRRGYRFNRARVDLPGAGQRLTVTTGQLLYEWDHLVRKLEVRSPGWLAALPVARRPEPHPMFVVVAGAVEAWEVRPAGL